MRTDYEDLEYKGITFYQAEALAEFIYKPNINDNGVRRVSGELIVAIPLEMIGIERLVHESGLTEKEISDAKKEIRLNL